MKFSTFRKPTPRLSTKTHETLDESFASSNAFTVPSSAISAGKFSKSKFTSEEIDCLTRLQTFCNVSRIDISNELIYRFAITHNFDFRKTRRMIANNHDHPLVHLRMHEELAHFMLSSSVVYFPLEGLKSKTGADIFYCRASRMMLSEEDSDLLIQNLSFVMKDMCRTPEQCRRGVVQLVDMRGYSKKNVAKNEITRMMGKIAGGQIVPASHAMILMVDPPKVFDRLWSFLKPLLPAQLVERIKLIKREKLEKYLMEGYEAYLPDEFDLRGKPIQEIVEDYVDVKLYEEEQRID